MKANLSIFIDESGDFGAYASHAPFYIVTMVLHDQKFNITENIQSLETHLHNLNYNYSSVHCGPIIRREEIYKNMLMEDRKKIFNALFNFARKLNFNYLCAEIDKKLCNDTIMMTAKLSRSIAELIRRNESFFNSFYTIIIYYDNGQVELTKTITSVFNTLYSNVEFRKVSPSNYKLFQVADLICTLELLKLKSSNNSFTKSELEFFGSPRTFNKNYYKAISRKKL